MSHPWGARKKIVVVAAFVLICVTALVAAGLAYQVSVPSAALGPNWQCSRLAFVFTICSRATQAGRTIVRVAREPVCSRLAGVNLVI